MQKHPWNTNGQSTASGGPHQNCVPAAQGTTQEVSKAKQDGKKQTKKCKLACLRFFFFSFALGSAERDFLSEMPT